MVSININFINALYNHHSVILLIRTLLFGGPGKHAVTGNESHYRKWHSTKSISDLKYCMQQNNKKKVYADL